MPGIFVLFISRCDSKRFYLKTLIINNEAFNIKNVYRQSEIFSTYYLTTFAVNNPSTYHPPTNGLTLVSCIREPLQPIKALHLFLSPTSLHPSNCLSYRLHVCACALSRIPPFVSLSLSNFYRKNIYANRDLAEQQPTSVGYRARIHVSSFHVRVCVRVCVYG